MNILLDMDGVMSNFVGACCRLFNKDEKEILANWKPNEYSVDVVFGITEQEMWRAIDENSYNFWSTLEEYEWAKDLYSHCRIFGNVYFLTSPSIHDQSSAGKVAWMKKFTGNAQFHDFLMGPPKFLCAKPDNVLIDDSDKNCNSFASAGGKTILFPQPWNALHSFKDSKLNYVISELEKLEIKS